MASKEELQKTYSGLSTMQLLRIIENASGYTNVAIDTAREELAKRETSPIELEEYEQQKQLEAENFIRNNIVNELSLVQKNLFFFLWPPMLSLPFRLNFREDGFVLKGKQARYYNLCGFMAFMLACMISALAGLQPVQSIAVWIVLFFPAYLLDDKFNRQYLIKKIENNQA